MICRWIISEENADDGIERRAQLMTHIGEELGFCLVGLHRLIAGGFEEATAPLEGGFAFGDGTGHDVQRARQLADLVAAARDRRRAVIAFTDAPRRCRERFQGQRERRARSGPRRQWRCSKAAPKTRSIGVMTARKAARRPGPKDNR